jgi:hypothetical protein
VVVLSDTLGIVDEVTFKRAQLRARVAAGWLSGEPASLIAMQLGIPRRTVHKIVASTPGLAEERAHRNAQKVTAVQADALAWSHGHPGDPIEDGAVVLGMSTARLGRVS